MMNSISMLPCAAFFADRRFMTGTIVLLMQASLLLWPWAVRWARQLNEKTHVDRMLYELSETHRVPVDPYAMPLKRFRQVA